MSLPGDKLVVGVNARAAGPHHQRALRPFILDSFIARVGESKTRLITEQSIQAYLSRHFLRFDPAVLHKMFVEADFRSEGCLTENDIKSSVTGLYRHRKHTGDWEQLVKMVTEEEDIFGEGDALTSRERRARRSSITFAGKSTTHFQELEHLSKSMRHTGSAVRLLRTLQGTKEYGMTGTEERIADLMGLGPASRRTPLIGFDAKQEYLAATGRDLMRDRLSRSQTAAARASVLMVRDGATGQHALDPADADASLFRTGKLRHMARPGTGGTENFHLYTRPLSVADLDFKKSLGKPLDLRSGADAEVQTRRAQGELIAYVAQVHDRSVTAMVAGRGRMLMFPDQGFNLQAQAQRARGATAAAENVPGELQARNSI